MLTYQGEKGSHLVKSLKWSIAKLLPKTTQLELGFTGSKVGTGFQIKEKMIFEHIHDVYYLGTSPENNCWDNYVGQSSRGISERIIDHSGRGQNSHFFNHSWIKNHSNTSKTDFKIINKCSRGVLWTETVQPLFGKFFSEGACLYRNHSIDLHCQSFDWFLYSCCRNRNSPKDFIRVEIVTKLAW